MVTSTVVGVGSTLPQQKVSSVDLLDEVQSEKKFGVSRKYLDRVVGVVERRMSDIDTKPSELATIAAEKAICSAGIDPKELGAVIFCGIETDDKEPSTAHRVQFAVGAENAFCYDTSNACHGFVDGLMQADAFIKAGYIESALVCTGETSSRCIRAMIRLLNDKEVSQQKFLEMIGFFTLGDAGGAVVVSRAEEEHGFKYLKSRASGAYADYCHYDYDDHGLFKGQMKMSDISGFFFKFNREFIDETYARLKWVPADVDYILCHQVGKLPHQKLLQLSGVDSSRVPLSYDKCGNLTSATIPYNLSRINPNQGSKILLFGAGSGATVTQGGLVL